MPRAVEIELDATVLEPIVTVTELSLDLSALPAVSTLVQADHHGLELQSDEEAI